jgi:hypothetical protein
VVAPPIRTAAITSNEDFFNGIARLRTFADASRQRGRHSQSIEPLRPTSAAVAQSPISA